MTRIGFADVVTMLSSSQMRGLIEPLRAMADHKQQHDYKAAKLPWFATPLFVDDIALNANAISTELIVIDIDGLPVESVSGVKLALSSDKHVALVFVSPGGAGIKAVFRLPEPIKDNVVHHQYYMWISRYLKYRYGLEADPGTKDIRRATYLSYDPEPYVNFEPVPIDKIEVKPEPEKSPTRQSTPRQTDSGDDPDEVMSACRYLCGSLSRDAWIKVGCGLRHKYGPSGLDYWLALSLSPQWPEDTREKLIARYNGFGDYPGRGAGIESLFYEANSRGWKPPRKTWAKNERKNEPEDARESRASVQAPPPPPVALPEIDTPDDAQLDNDDYINTDVRNARRWMACTKNDYLYNHDSGKWLHWCGTHWEKDLKKRAEYEFCGLSAKIRQDILNCDPGQRRRGLALSKELESVTVVNKALQAASWEPELSTVADDYNADPYTLNVLNGTIDLHTGVLRNHRREDRITQVLDVTYNPDADAPVFDKYLNHVTGGDTGFRAYILRVMGYILTGSITEEVMFWLIGPRHTGKTVFLHILQRLMKGYYVVLSTDMILQAGMHNNQGNQIATLEGMRLGVFGELDEKLTIRDAILKDLTGGDRLQANQKFEKPHTFNPTAKLIVAGNHPPVITSGDAATWRRVRIIPFENTVTEDMKIPLDDYLAMIEAELSGVLNMAVRGCLDWQKRIADRSEGGGLGEPEDLEKNRSRLRSELNPVEKWVDERTMPAPDDGRGLDVRAAYADYSEWMKSSGDRPLIRANFTRRLKEIDGWTAVRCTDNVIFFSYRRLIDAENVQPYRHADREQKESGKWYDR